jgi:hypothetical protein
MSFINRGAICRGTCLAELNSGATPDPPPPRDTPAVVHGRAARPHHSQMLKSPFGVDVSNVQLGLVEGQSPLDPQAMNVGAPSPGHISCCLQVTVPVPLPSAENTRQQFRPPGQSAFVKQGRSIFSQASFS